MYLPSSKLKQSFNFDMTIFIVAPLLKNQSHVYKQSTNIGKPDSRS